MTARVGGLREKVAAPEGLHAGTEFVLIGGRALQWKGADVVPLGVVGVVSGQSPDGAPPASGDP